MSHAAIPNLARACLAFAEGFAQLAAHFGAPAGTIAVEIGMEPANPAENAEISAPAPVSAPEAEKASETAVSAAPAEPPPPAPPTPPAPLTEDGLRQLVIRAFETGRGDLVTAFLAAAGVQRVTQLDEAGRKALADKLAIHFGAPYGKVDVSIETVDAAEKAPETPAKAEKSAPASVSAPKPEKAPEKTSPVPVPAASPAPSQEADEVMQCFCPTPIPPAPVPAPLTEDGLRQLVIRAFETGRGGIVTAFLASAGVQRVTQLDEAGRQALADKLAGEGVARC